MNAPQKIVSTKMLLDSKIRRWGAPSIHFEEPLKTKKETSLVSASRERGGGEGMEMSAEDAREGAGKGSSNQNAFQMGFK